MTPEEQEQFDALNKRHTDLVNRHEDLIKRVETLESNKGKEPVKKEKPAPPELPKEPISVKGKKYTWQTGKFMYKSKIFLAAELKAVDDPIAIELVASGSHHLKPYAA